MSEDSEYNENNGNVKDLSLSNRQSRWDGRKSSSSMGPMTDDYNKWNQSQSTVWKQAKHLFAKALEELHKQKQDNSMGGPTSLDKTAASFRIADWGCSTGGNSLAPLSYVYHRLLQQQNVAATFSASHKSILEVFVGDLPENPWSSLVATVTPETIATFAKDSAVSDKTMDDAEIALQGSPDDIFVYMVGKSFYEVCAAPNSLDLSYSMVAIHWMKSYPIDIPTGLYATDPDFHNTDPSIYHAWKEAGRQDFTDFVHARYQELRIGGYFIGTIACAKQLYNQHYPWSQVGHVFYDALLNRVHQYLQAQQQQQRKDPSSSAEPTLDDVKTLMAPCVLPCCWRSEEEVRSAFESVPGSDCWEIQILEFHENKDPVRQALEDRAEISPTEYAQSVAQAFNAVCQSTIKTSLHSIFQQQHEQQNASSDPDSAMSMVDQVMREAYEDCIPTIAAKPAVYNLDVSFWYVLAQKTA